MLVASRNCHLYELYDAHRTRRGWAAGSGAIFNLRSDRLRPDGWTSADAAGLPILPGLVRPDEIRAGHIDHALRFTVETTQRGYIHPATHQAGATNSANYPPMGARFRLKASVSLKGFTLGLPGRRRRPDPPLTAARHPLLPPSAGQIALR